MWVLPAGSWPCFVDGTVVVCSQEGTRRYVQHVVSVVVKVQVLFYQLGGADTQVTGQPLDVNVPKDRTGRFTTIGTRQTIDFLENFIVQIME